jgi:phenylacetate-coenzyme A ligase PaaK-like adenylate-forming protein
MLRQSIDGKPLSRSLLEATKLAKFRAFVSFLSTSSPYYADIVRSRSIDPWNCSPQDFPVLTKAILNEQFDSIVTVPDVRKRDVEAFLTRSRDPRELLLDKYLVIHTSGSSGEVGYFVYSEADWARATARQNRGNAQTAQMSRWRVAYYAAVDGHYAGVSTFTNPWRRVEPNIEIGLFDVNDPLSAVLEKLNRFQPDSLCGYTTALRILAERQAAGELHIKPVVLRTGGEALTERDRELLSTTFGCDVGGWYGSSEHLLMGTTKYGSTDMVLYDDDLMYEFFDDHTLITNLFNRTLPLVRYRMADVIRPAYEDRSSEPYLTIRSLVGRSELVPTFVNRRGEEDYISAITIAELFVAGITRFQMHLISKTEFLLKVLLDRKLSRQEGEEALRAMRERLAGILRQKSLDNVRFDVHAVDDLPVDPRTRKFKLVADGATESIPRAMR